MKNITRHIFVITRSLVAGSTLALFAVGAQAGTPANGSITFSPLAAESIPALGSTMLVMLSMLLAFIAFVSFRRRQNGTLPLLAGALALASLVSAGGGVSLLQKAYAAGMSVIIVNPAGETKAIVSGINNTYLNNSGTPLRVGPVSLPSGCPSEVLGAPGACGVGSVLAVDDQCGINCAISDSDARLKTDIVKIGMTESGLPWYRFRYLNHETVYEGVMAQDVLTHTPAAVHLKSDGYMAVDYAMLGLTMRSAQ
jgi:hypothetical protein